MNVLSLQCCILISAVCPEFKTGGAVSDFVLLGRIKNFWVGEGGGRGGKKFYENPIRCNFILIMGLFPWLSLGNLPSLGVNEFFSHEA